MPTVVIPWRSGCPHRERALGWVLSQYAKHHPDWQVIVSTAAEADGPWRKADATMPAVEAADDGIVIVADADVWCDGLDAAVDAVEGGAPWAIPHRLVWRLSRRGSAEILDGRRWHNQTLAQRQYPGMEGGGFVVAWRETLLDVPMPVVDGWSAEDESWALALRTVVGEPWRGHSDLLHLWHPPQERSCKRWGSNEARAVARRYRDANGDPEAMRALIAEEATCLSPA